MPPPAPAPAPRFRQSMAVLRWGEGTFGTARSTGGELARIPSARVVVTLRSVPGCDVARPAPFRPGCRIGAFEHARSSCRTAKGGESKGARRKGRVEGSRCRPRSSAAFSADPVKALRCSSAAFGRPCKSSTIARCRRPRSCGSPAPLGRQGDSETIRSSGWYSVLM
jgi:hypothetical protein